MAPTSGSSWASVACVIVLLLSSISAVQAAFPCGPRSGGAPQEVDYMLHSITFPINSTLSAELPKYKDCCVDACTEDTQDRQYCLGAIVGHAHAVAKPNNSTSGANEEQQQGSGEMKDVGKRDFLGRMFRRDALGGAKHGNGTTVKAPETALGVCTWARKNGEPRFAPQKAAWICGICPDGIKVDPSQAT